MMSWVKNSVMFNSSITVCDKMQNWSDFLQFWKIFNLMRILINLLKFWKFAELLKVNLLFVFLYLWDCIVCYFCKQFISIWKFTMLIWMKINSETDTVIFFVFYNWLKNIWKYLFRFLFCMSFWKIFSNLFWK